ncbi:hypothetical protein ACLOJK_038195 [Asimina triloba]
MVSWAWSELLKGAVRTEVGSDWAARIWHEGRWLRCEMGSACCLVAVREGCASRLP